MSQPLKKRTNTFRNFLSVLLAVSLLGSYSSGAQQLELPFPEAPHEELTPGELCDKADNYRYPERIPYCNRKVDSSTKYEIIDEYDQKLGYRIRATGREHFKIDHYIPLCMGGSNNVENLWPQHKSVYELTDPLEPELCNRMAAGSMKQAEAMEIIRSAKANPKNAPEIFRRLTGRSPSNGNRR